MPKTISLTLGERLQALRIMDSFKGNLTTMSALLEDVKPMAITDEEWKAADLVKTKSADGQTESWKWNEEGQEKEIEIQQPTLDYISAEIKRMSDANEITLAQVALISLDKKLK